MAAVKLGISISKDLKDKLKQQAENEGTTTTQLVAFLTSQHVKKRRKNARKARENNNDSAT